MTKLEDLKVAELKKMAKSLKLATAGTRGTLIARINFKLNEGEKVEEIGSIGKDSIKAGIKNTADFGKHAKKANAKKAPKVNKNIKWTEETSMEAVKKSKSYTDFRNSYSGACRYFWKLKRLEEVKAIILKNNPIKEEK